MKSFSLGMMLSSLLFIQIGCGEETPPAAPTDAPTSAPPAAMSEIAPIQDAPKADDAPTANDAPKTDAPAE